MAVQGLFTQGPSVDDILAKRNKSQFDLQQQLMNQAAQGARDPAKMRAVSLLGSSLGRALGGAMGGQDEELEKRKAEIAEQKRLQGEYLGIERGGSEEMFAFAQDLADKGLGDAARQMNTAAIAKQQLELEKKQDDQKKAEDDLVILAEAEAEAQEAIDLQVYAKTLASQLEASNKPLAKILNSGTASQGIIDEAEKKIAALGDKEKNGDQNKKFTTQISGEDLNALQGTTNYNPTTMFSANSSTGTLSAVGQTGLKDDSTESKGYTQVTGAALNKQQKTTAYNPATLYQVNKDNQQITPIQGTGTKASKGFKPILGSDLNARTGTTAYQPTQMYLENLDNNKIEPIQGTGTTRSEASQAITDAYGFEHGSPEWKELYQQKLAIGPSLSISDVKTVTDSWATTSKDEQEKIGIAEELLGLIKLENNKDVKAPEQLSIIADRFTSRLFGGSDTKAQAEIAAFRETGSIGQRLAKSATMFLSGTYNEQTFEGFKALAEFALARNSLAYDQKLVKAKANYALTVDLTEDQTDALFGDMKGNPIGKAKKNQPQNGVQMYQGKQVLAVNGVIYEY
mgnify:CR=1 FL=1